MLKQIKEQLAKLNFNVKIVELSYKDYTQAIADGNYDMYLGELKIPANMNISQFFTENSITNSAITLADQNENLQYNKIFLRHFRKNLWMIE